VENLIWDRVWICCKTLLHERRVKIGIADHHLVILRTGVRISAKETVLFYGTKRNHISCLYCKIV
jgi:hypothetical protein